jgi:glycosyltransferase involved in cell wall biosynthesis
MAANTQTRKIDPAQVIRVLFITHNYIRRQGDFAGVFLHLLARKLKEHNVDVLVVAPHDGGLKEYEIIDGVRIFRFRYGPDEEETFAYRGDMDRQLFRNPFKIFRLYKFLQAANRKAQRIIEKEAIDVVSIHWAVPNGLIGYRLKKKYGDKIRLVLSSHGTDIRLLTGVPLVYNFFRRVIRQAEKWTVVSNYLKSLINQKSPEFDDRIEVVPLPNDETIFHPDREIHKEPQYIVSVARLTAQKRIPVLIEAMKKVTAEIHNARLEIFGAGPEKERLNKIIMKSGLDNNIKILDPVPQPELSKIYCRAGMVILNSVDEGFGLALTEAALCMTAVIGTNSGGIPDIIEHEKTGLLVPPDNADMLAEAIIRLIKDNRLRSQLALNGYNHAVANFSSEASAKRYADIFHG